MFLKRGRERPTVRVFVQDQRIRLAPFLLLLAALSPVTFHLQLKLHRITIMRGNGLPVIFRFLPPAQPSQTFPVTLQRHETEAVRQHFILNDGCVLVDKHIFYSKERNLGEEDTAEGVSEGRVETYERKDSVKRLVVVELDVEVL